MTKSKKILLIIFIIALIGLYAVIYAVPGVTGALTKTEILQYGTLQVTDQETCYIVREEKVYNAGSAGTINYYIEDGVQLREGTQVLAVTAGHSDAEEPETAYADIITRLGSDAAVTQTYKNEFNGVVSYYVDGYENFFTPEKMKELDYSDVRDLKIETENLVRASTMKNEPLYKICKYDQWYILCWVAGGSITKYEPDKTVVVNFPMGDIKAKVQDIIEQGDYWLVILKTNRYYEDFAKTRKQEATIVTSDYSGIIIENESLATEDGVIGVYVKSKSGEYKFTPIKVITTDGESSLAEVSYYYDEEGNKVDTVEIYDEILKRP